MFELHIAETGVTDGAVPVTWCVDLECLKDLSERGIKDPMVVLVTAAAGDNYSQRKECRTVVPLKDLMGYVEFRSSGPNKIWGFISELGKKDTCNRYLSKEGGGFETNILDYGGTEWGSRFDWVHELHKNKPIIGSDVLTVEVPAECFAPEPSAIEKAWVNWLYKSKCVDQCDFRRRRLFAYTVQVPIMVCNVIIRLFFTMIGLLIGARNFSFMPLLQPLSYDFSDAQGVMGGGTIFIRKSDTALGSLWTVPFMPIIAAVLTGLVYLTVRKHAGWTVTISLAIIGALVTALFFGISYLLDWHAVRCIEAAKAPAWYTDPEEIEMVLCNGKKATTVGQLPARKRSFRLRFLDLKSKVCRPFSA